jgi:hypothetical protein
VDEVIGLFIFSFPQELATPLLHEAFSPARSKCLAKRLSLLLELLLNKKMGHPITANMTLRTPKGKDL